MNVDLGTTITIGAGESARVHMNGAYYLDVNGQGVANGILLVRTRYSLRVLATSQSSTYDKLGVSPDDTTSNYVILTNNATVELAVKYRRL